MGELRAIAAPVCGLASHLPVAERVPDGAPAATSVTAGSRPRCTAWCSCTRRYIAHTGVSTGAEQRWTLTSYAQWRTPVSLKKQQPSQRNMSPTCVIMQRRSRATAMALDEHAIVHLLQVQLAQHQRAVKLAHEGIDRDFDHVRSVLAAKHPPHAVLK